MSDPRASAPVPLAPGAYEPPAVAAPEPCVSCGEPAGTPYCPHCGERRAADRPLRLRALAEEAWDEFAAVDGRVLRSFWTLVRRPGALTAAYLRGERLRYLTPLRLFLVVNVVYFLYVTATGQNTFTTPLRVHLHGTPYSELARRVTAARFSARHTTEDAYARRFDPVAAAQAKSLVIALVPLFAACVAVVLRGRRRPALQHAAFAFHAVSVLVLALMAVSWGAALGGAAAQRLLGPVPQPSDGQESVAILLVLWGWLAFAIRRAYGGGRGGAAARGAALALCVAPVLLAYRLLLFFTTYWVT